MYKFFYLGFDIFFIIYKCFFWTRYDKIIKYMPFLIENLKTHGWKNKNKFQFLQMF